MTKLTRIRSRGGAEFTVAAEHAPRFQALINDLEASGYAIDPQTSGGYNPRNIRGTNTPSQHAFGRAIDVNWGRNAVGTQGDIPGDLALSLAQKHGMTWGGTWGGRRRDPMHFEIARDVPAPMAERSLTAFAGAPASSSEPAAVPTETFSSAPFGATPDAAKSEAKDGMFGSLSVNDLSSFAKFFEANSTPIPAPPPAMAMAPQVDMKRIASVLASRPMLGTRGMA